MLGDGEAETGPLAASWHSNKFLNPARDGAVLPILHLNGYKIANPTVLGRMSDDELSPLFMGYGYKPHFVERHVPETMHQLMAHTLDTIIEIHDQQQMDDVLNNKSGLLGVSGGSNDTRKVLEATRSGNELAVLAFDIFVHRVRSCIGSMVAALELRYSLLAMTS